MACVWHLVKFRADIVPTAATLDYVKLMELRAWNTDFVICTVVYANKYYYVKYQDPV
jgi:hypothetical protein